MSSATNSPPRAPPIKYAAPLGTRWAKEKAAAGGANAFDLPTDPKSIGPWILGECIGKGASGRVKIAKHRRTGQLAAVKILPIAPLVNSRKSLDTQQTKYEKQRLGVDREITMMKLMNHPNIMRIYDVFEGEKELFLVLEYVEGGELFDFLVNRGRLPPQEALEYFKQIIYGLNYAHTFSIIHRDLKPENILIASLSPPLVKIADWGMAAFAPPTLQLETSCGSPHYASPEIVNGEKYQGNTTDIWSCGVILYALLTGRLPFDDKNVRTLLAKVKSGKYDMPTWIDPLAKDLLSRMLVVDVTKRITIPEILVHPWLTNSSTSPHTKGKASRRLTPPLPPSPSTVARPIASSDLIDPELFSSLRVIWGRHADLAGETIKQDLCAPAGQGVYTKAFYYLLSKYREDSYRKRLTDGENMNDTTELNGVNILQFDHCWKDPSDAKMSAFGIQRQSAIPVVSSASPRRKIISIAAQSPDTQPRRLSVLPPLMDRARAVSGDRLRGPRPIPSPQQMPCRLVEHYQSYHHSSTQTAGPVRPVSSISTATRTTAAGPRAQPPRRGYTSCQSADKQITIEEPVDSRTRGYFSPRTHEEGRKNTIMPMATAHRGKPNIREMRIPSPTFQGTTPPVSPHLECQKNSAERVALDVRSPRINLHVQSKEKHSSNSITSPGAVHSKLSNVTRTRSHTHTPGHYKSIHSGPEQKDSGQKRHLHFQSSGGEDKENQSRTAENAPTVPPARRASGIGLGMGIGGARDICQEMGNVIYIGTGNTPVPKGKKERKNKPPTLDLPVRRTTLSALGSPIASSSLTATHPDVGSPARLLASPVVGEFKEWFSSLFNWKAGGNNAHANAQNILYSPDDVNKTWGDIGRLLESLSVIVVFEGSAELSESSRGDCLTTARLKCRVEELSVDTQTNICLKPVRFRVEFTPVQQTRPLIRQSHWSPPLSPITDNTCFFLPPTNEEDNVSHGKGSSPTTTPFLSAPNPGLTPRVRMSMLPVVAGAPSGQSTPMPSPGLNDVYTSPTAGLIGSCNSTPHIPYGSLCAVLFVYEKGSMPSFKTIWRKVKDVYCGSPIKVSVVQSPEGFDAFSPMMVSTPISQACPTGQFTTAGC
ncbi:hypothetical protein AX15_003595 [Amanita polypyramis BW_CC]|nr:hypothetical protein AX15_003595 [Amanita polypyramis BW_CC]